MIQDPDTPGVPHERLFRLPAVKRAREFYLYAPDGTRYLDLWQNNGLAYRGHSPAGFTQAIKNRISTKLFGPLPNSLFLRLTKGLTVSYPEYEPRIFPSQEAAILCLQSIGITLDHYAFSRWQPAASPEGQEIAFHRPDTPSPESGLILPILPQLAGYFGQILMVQKQHPLLKSIFSPGASPIQIEAMLLGLALFSPEIKPEAKHRPRGQNRDRSQMPPPESLHTPGFHRSGRYLIPRLDQEQYFVWYKAARTEKFVFNPYWRGVSILPAHASKGEWDRLKALFQEVPA